jgi:uncharacterized protein with PQ loop repeat
MTITPADAALGVFTLCNTARVFAYLPQIVKIGRDTQGAAAISYTTWALFGVSHLSTVAYAILVVDDWRMAAVFAANALCCLIILSLTAWKRAVFKATLMVLEAAMPSKEHPDVTAKSRIAGTTLTNKSDSRPFRLRVVSDRSGPS